MTTAEAPNPKLDDSAAPTVGRLPRGRHQLSRDEVHSAQRDRMLLAMVEAVSHKGYVATSVADVIKGAGVSRQTFYEQFSAKLDCFMAAFDAAAEILLATIAEGVGRGVDGDDHHDGGSEARSARFAQVLTRYLDTLADHRSHAIVFLVEVYAAGPVAIERRAALQERLADGLAEILGATTERERFACTMLVAATGSLVTKPLVDNDPAALRALRTPIIDLVTHTLRRSS